MLPSPHLPNTLNTNVSILRVIHTILILTTPNVNEFNSKNHLLRLYYVPGTKVSTVVNRTGI